MVCCACFEPIGFIEMKFFPSNSRDTFGAQQVQFEYVHVAYMRAQIQSYSDTLLFARFFQTLSAPYKSSSNTMSCALKTSRTRPPTALLSFNGIVRTVQNEWDCHNERRKDTSMPARSHARTRYNYRPLARGCLR